jgi:putative FmdB family regulatory protein
LYDFCLRFFMPIYAYRCEACGFAKDVLQKVSDPQLTECPTCGKATFKKQVTAAGFQLKGTGWYVTDFRGGGAGTSAPAVPEAASGTQAAPAAPTTEKASTSSASSTASTAASSSTSSSSGGDKSST